jgi:branched-subunit amino acid ABC-type transport system permease component
MRPPPDLLRRLGRLAWLLDSAFVLPGTRFRFGLDALIGLIPGLGDALGVVISSYIIREAARVGAPPSVLARMAFNVALEGIVGLVPIAGDVFDAAWKANQRNVALLEAHSHDPKTTVRSSRLVVTLVILGLVVFLVFVAFLGFLIARAVWHAIAG